MSQTMDDLPLRRKLREADKLTRELTDHLEHGFIAKAHRLRRTARQGADPVEGDEVTDVVVRESVDTFLGSDDFARDICQRLTQYVTAIDRDIQRILGIS